MCVSFSLKSVFDFYLFAFPLQNCIFGLFVDKSLVFLYVCVFFSCSDVPMVQTIVHMSNLLKDLRFQVLEMDSTCMFVQLQAQQMIHGEISMFSDLICFTWFSLARFRFLDLNKICLYSLKRK